MNLDETMTMSCSSSKFSLETCALRRGAGSAGLFQSRWPKGGHKFRGISQMANYDLQL